MRQLVLIVVCLLSTVASAQINKQIVSLMNEAEYEKASRLILTQLAQPTAGELEPAQLHWFLGLCEISMGNLIAAKQTFKKLLLIQPLFKPPNSVSPKVLEVWEQARQEAVDNRSLLDIYRSATQKPSLGELKSSTSTNKNLLGWPLWTSIALVAAGGLIYGAIVLFTPNEGSLRVVVR